LFKNKEIPGMCKHMPQILEKNLRNSLREFYSRWGV
jgi:hypothetical protein